MTTRPELSAIGACLLACASGVVGCDNPMLIGVHDGGIGENHATGGSNAGTWASSEPGGGAFPVATGGNGDFGGTSTLSTGGMSNSSTGGAAIGGGSPGTVTDDTCNSTNPQYDGSGELMRAGASDPYTSVGLGVDGYLVSEGVAGYCFAYADNKPGGSTIFPPCGSDETCFTQHSGLCVTAALGVASGSVWGAGLGCALNQAAGSGAMGDPISLVDKTTLSIGLVGCKVPSSVRLQLNINPPLYDTDTDRLHSGYYCADVALSGPDANGVRRGSVPISALHEDCWESNGLTLDSSQQTAESMQLQVNADPWSRTNWDFCVTELWLL